MVLGISSAILGAEVIVGLLANSLALLADAGHVFADVVGTALALTAIWLGSRPATRTQTFGFYRFEILAAVLNGMLLFAIAAYVLIEAWRRLGSEPVIATGPMLAVAAAALAANGVARAAPAAGAGRQPQSARRISRGAERRVRFGRGARRRAGHHVHRLSGR